MQPEGQDRKDAMNGHSDLDETTAVALPHHLRAALPESMVIAVSRQTAVLRLFSGPAYRTRIA